MLTYGFAKNSRESSAEELFIHALQELLTYFSGKQETRILIEEGIEQYAQGSFDVTQRFQLLERIYPIIDGHVRKRHIELLTKPMALTEKKYSSLDADVLQQALVVAYITLFTDKNVAETDGELDKEGNRVQQCLAKSKSTIDTTKIDKHIRATSMHRAVSMLSELQRWSCQIYHEPSIGMWKSLHYIYVHAQTYDAEGYIPLVQTRVTTSHLTVLDLYKDILLFDAANTAVMQPQEMDSVYHLLSGRGALASLRELGNRADLYTICLTKDHGAIYQSLVVGEIKRPETWRTLDTTELGIKIAALYAQAKSQGEITVNNKVLNKALLLHLSQTWSSKPIRKYRRVCVDEKQGVLQLALLDSAKMETLSDKQAWDIINTSAGGYCLSKEVEQPLPLEVGQLLRISENAEVALSNANLAIIRWLSCDSTDETQLGVELLAPEAERIAIKMGRRKVHALFVPEIRATKVPNSLILPCAVGKEGDVLTLPQGKVKLGKQLQSSLRFNQYQIAFIDV